MDNFIQITPEVCLAKDKIISITCRVPYTVAIAMLDGVSCYTFPCKTLAERAAFYNNLMTRLGAEV